MFCEQASAYRYYSAARKELGDEEGWRRFNPFYYLMIPPLHEGESAEMYEALASNSQKHSQRYSLAKLRANFVGLLRETKNWAIDKNASAEILNGVVDEKAIVFLVTWVGRSGLPALMNQGRDAIWGSLRGQLNEDGVRHQTLIIPTFYPTQQEVSELVQAGYLIYAPNAWMDPLDCARAVGEMGVATVRGWQYFGRADWGLAYGAGVLSTRTWRSARLEAKLKTLTFPKGAIALLPWENQPEQWGICSALRSAGLRVHGFIHSGLTHHASYLSRSREARLSDIYPHKLYAPGFGYHEGLVAAGWDPAELQTFCSLRISPSHAVNYAGVLFTGYSKAVTVESLQRVRALVEKGELRVKRVQHHPINREDPKIIELTRQIRTDESATSVIVAGFSSIILEVLEAGLVVDHLIEKPQHALDPVLYPHVKSRKINEHLIELSLPEQHRGSLILEERASSVLSIVEAALGLASD